MENVKVISTTEMTDISHLLLGSCKGLVKVFNSIHHISLILSQQDFISLCNVDVKRFTAPFREVISPLLFIPVFIPRDICNNGEKYQRKLFDLKLPAWSKIISEDWFPADRVCKTGWDRKFHNYINDKD